MAGQYSPSIVATPLSLGQWLRKARTESKLAIREIAALAGIDSSHLGKYERGDRIPPLAQSIALAAAYRLPLIELKQRIVARQLLATCEGDAELAHSVLSCVQEEAAAYGVNNTPNKF